MQSTPAKQANIASWWRDLVFLGVIFFILYFLFLGARTLGVPDEARYSEIPREMLLLHDAVTPHLDFVPYFEKPPLFYWMQSGAQALFGLSETVCRLMSMCMSLIGILVTYAGARTLFDRKTAVIAAIILGSMLLYYAMGHLITTDMTVSVFLTASILSLFIAMHQPPCVRKRVLMYIATIAAALAVLTKGLIGVVFPWMVVGLWMIWQQEWRKLRQLYFVSSLLLFFVIVLPWHVLAQLRYPSFFHFYIITQQFSRYATMIAERYQPCWFFIPIILAGVFPWLGFLFQSLWNTLKGSRRHAPNASRMRFLLVWAVSIFLFFSASHSKLIPYIIPVLPPLAIMIAHYMTREQLRGIRIGYVINVAISIIILIAIVTAIALPSLANDIPADTHTSLIAIAVCWLVASIIAAYYAWQQRGHLAIAVLSILSVAGFIVLSNTADRLDPHSIKPLAQIINHDKQPGDRIVSYKHYYQDLPFYTQQKVVIVDWINELEFGLTLDPDASQWVITREAFTQNMKNLGNHHAFVVLQTRNIADFEKDYTGPYQTLAHTPQSTLLVIPGETPHDN